MATVIELDFLDESNSSFDEALQLPIFDSQLYEVVKGTSMN
jgi:hypothetical protein